MKGHRQRATGRARVGFKVLLVASEATPYARTGGLGEVTPALAAALARQGCEVKIVIPYYGDVRNGKFSIELYCEDLEIPFLYGPLPADVFWTRDTEGCAVYFIRREEFYDRAYLYGTPKGDYFDNASRFAYLSKSVFALCKRIGFRPDVLHCHDWHTALVPAYLKYVYHRDPFFATTASLMTLHNLAYQGIFTSKWFPWTGLPRAMNTVDGMEFYGKINYLKAGIVCADVINTVSPTYRKEILSEEYGYGLAGTLRRRKRDLYGILNGAAYDMWDPRSDPYLEAPFSIDAMGGKATCKKVLCDMFGIRLRRPQRPLIGMVARLTEQKGIDILVEALEGILQEDIGFVALGDGERTYQDMMKAFANRHPGTVAVHIGYDTGLAHRIIAGCDMFVMPSKYEPCGLSQFYCMRYGTVPIVRATGGLEDSVVEFDPVTGKGTGFKFTTYSAQAFRGALEKALRTYCDKHLWKTLQKNCMKQDFSWDRAADKYLELYRTARSKKGASYR